MNLNHWVGDAAVIWRACTPVAMVLGMWTDGDLFMGRTGALWEEATETDLRFLLKWIRRYPGCLYSQTFMRLKDARHKKCFDTSFNTNIAPEIGVLICWFWRWNRTDASHLDGLECEKKACEPMKIFSQGLFPQSWGWAWRPKGTGEGKTTWTSLCSLV